MSEPGSPTEQTPHVKPQRDLIGIICLLLVLGGTGFLGYSVFRDKGPDYPDEWDSRVLPYVKIVEKERDLKFKHPVTVEFLAPEEFEETVSADKDDLSKDEKEEIDQFTGLTRAIGLISGDVDLFEAFNDVRSSGTLAYYSFKSRSVTVRGTELTPASKSTLVHELTHALQDQHFDIGTRTQELDKDAEDGDTKDGEGSVLDAVIEGDARRIETKYANSLSEEDRRALEKSQAEEVDDAEQDIKDVPKVVVTIVSSPYALGEALVTTVDQHGGNGAVDDLFRDTPKHESALLDPFTVITDSDGATEVDAPELEDGAEEFETGEFGALTTFFMLAERLPIRDALAASDAWGGDRYVGYEEDGSSCVQIAYAGESTEATQTLFTALSSWIGAAPGTPSSVERDGDRVLFRSCDPGTEGPKGNDVSQEALALASARTFLGLTFMQGSGAPAKSAQCFATGLIQEFTIQQLNDPELAKDPAVQRKVQALGAACR